MIPGEYILKSDPIEINSGKRKIFIEVTNMGDRPVQIGSHFHFFEVNKKIKFDRMKTLGLRLNIAAGTAVRFEPGEEKKVELVEIGGTKTIIGFNNLVDGTIDTANLDAIENKMNVFLKE
ncbi:urease subunit beta [Flavobacterium paronense]|uniref:Urease subunit beta n=1 Tax=Flavobacterium paronense TaxID=1392775 RepID=A0ABV5GG63_9FLAO|nr:urease subunit beta [Flavobacterium paronense]MDN3676928.1 urease subunit beta [Flavobacterium paronense]